MVELALLTFTEGGTVLKSRFKVGASHSKSFTLQYPRSISDDLSCFN